VVNGASSEGLLAVKSVGRLDMLGILGMLRTVC